MVSLLRWLGIRQGCGRGVTATLGGRMGNSTFGCSPASVARKATSLSISSAVDLFIVAPRLQIE
jgi:hypothetical protein